MICLSLLLQFVAVYAAGAAGESIVDEWTYDNSILVTIDAEPGKIYTPADFPEIDAKEVLIIEKNQDFLELIVVLRVGSLRSGGSRSLCAIAYALSNNPLVQRVHFNEYMLREPMKDGYVSGYQDAVLAVIKEECYDDQKTYTPEDFPGFDFQYGSGSWQNNFYLHLLTPGHYNLCYAVDELAKNPSVKSVCPSRLIPGYYTPYGDSTGDRRVDIDDILEIREVIFGNYIPPLTAKCRNFWDVNSDGVIDIDDILQVRGVTFGTIQMHE